MDKVPLPGSERLEPAGSRIGTPSQDERFSVSVVLRPRSIKGERFPKRFGHKVLSRKEFAAVHGADPQDIARVEAFARENNLSVEGVYPAKRSVELSGTASDFSRAFQVALALYEYEGKQFRGHTDPIHLPAELVPLVQGILGLDSRPMVTPADVGTSTVELNSIQDIVSAYNFPTSVDGSGQTVGIICLGGFDPKDLVSFFGKLGLSVPTIIPVPVGGNNPGQSIAGDEEVTKDIEMVGAIAPFASIVAYFEPPFFNFSLILALRDAVHDAANKPSVITTSFKIIESLANDADKQMLEGFCQNAADLGITVLASSGDQGSNGGVQVPASCPHVTACGGTVAAIAGGAIVNEVVWNVPPHGSGGGVSDFYDVPPYQSQAGVPASATNPGRIGRGIPDVAGHADAFTDFVFQGQDQVFNGTSAVAPLWAGLIALLNQLKGFNQGFLNPVLYGRLGPQGALNDVTSGNNGAYSAGTGWDACTGWGSPNVGVIAGQIGPPTIVNVLPATGPVGGGTQVAIVGSRLAGVILINFGNTPANFDPSDPNNSDSQIIATSPRVSSDGPVDITVTTRAGTSAVTPADLFTYFFPVPFVTSISPNSGPVGTPVTIVGGGFTGVTGVEFDGTGSPNVTPDPNNPDTQLTADSPQGNGTVDVRVSNPVTTSAPTSADQFTYS